MSTEIISLLELISPIIFFAIAYTIFVIKKYGRKDFIYNFLNSIFSEAKILIYALSLYYMVILFDNIHADIVMTWGLKIIVVLCWFVWIMCTNSSEKKKKAIIHRAKLSQAVLGYYTNIKNEYCKTENHEIEQVLKYYNDTVEQFCWHLENSNIKSFFIKQKEVHEPNLYSIFYEYKFQNLNIKEINETVCLFGVLDALLIDISLGNYLSENDIKILDFFLTKLQSRSREGISKKIDDLKSKLFLLDENNYTTTWKKAYHSNEIQDLADFLTKLLNSYLDCHVL